MKPSKSAEIDQADEDLDWLGDDDDDYPNFKTFRAQVQEAKKKWRLTEQDIDDLEWLGSDED